MLGGQDGETNGKMKTRALGQRAVDPIRAQMVML